MVICLERGADLHMAQLMPLPLTVSCFSKIQIGFTFLVPADPDSPGKGPLMYVSWCYHACCCYPQPTWYVAAAMQSFTVSTAADCLFVKFQLGEIVSSSSWCGSVLNYVCLWWCSCRGRTSSTSSSRWFSTSATSRAKWDKLRHMALVSWHSLVAKSIYRLTPVCQSVSASSLSCRNL